jgi:hypothetical protein
MPDLSRGDAHQSRGPPTLSLEGRQHLNFISGRVELKETAVGIPGLLVVIHDVDPATKPEESIRAARRPNGNRTVLGGQSGIKS